jgi:hypothetical protein
MIRVRSSDALMQERGQGDAYVVSPMDFSAFHNGIAQRNEDESRKAKIQADHDKELKDKLDYNPKSIWNPVSKKHEEKVLDVLKHSARLKANPVPYDHPDRIDYETKKAKIEQDINKGAELEKAYIGAHARAKGDDYYHTDKIANEINNITFGEDRKGLRGVDEINLDDYEKPFQNPDNFNMTHAAQKFTKDLPEQVKSYISQQKNEQGERFNENLVKSKFYKYDNSGNQIRDTKGNPVINITPETKHAFYNSHPLIQPYIAKAMERPENKGKSEDQILQEIVSPYAVHESNKSIGGLSKNGDGDDDKKITFSRSYDKNRIMTYKDRADGVTKTEEGNVAEVVTPAGKNMNRVVPLTPTKLYDESTNSEIDKSPGLKNVKIVEFQKRYYEPSTGKFLHGSKDKIEKKYGKHAFKWVAVGDVYDESGKEVVSHVFMPYDDISNEIETQYGIKKSDIYGKQDSSDPLKIKSEKSTKSDPLGIL